MSQSYFLPQRDFHSLSVKDLLEARDAYHVHLAHMENVVATAIGRFRIRKDDPDAKAPATGKTEPRRSYQAAEPRTLGNTIVAPWSWPCILVFVDNWMEPEEFRHKLDQAVPRFLYLPDGRVVPTCVIYAPQQEIAPQPLFDLRFPNSLLGGGYPVLTDVQGRLHVGSIGCLVTDGNATYALTNRHVVGETGSEVYGILGGERQRIGTSDHNQIGNISFEAAYPGWPGTRTHACLDAGLIRVDDANAWTSQVFGIGELDAPVDLNVDTISLDLVGCPVRAFGAASGTMTGEIQALFYRYRAVGGFDYVTDLLIGSRAGEVLPTRHGDSGTLWFFDPKDSLEEAQDKGEAGRRARRLRPLALQWGGHRLMGGPDETVMPYALATCLSTVCRALEVEVIRDWGIGLSEYWGQVGHYKIGAAACTLFGGNAISATVRDLFTNNQLRIGFGDDDIAGGTSDGTVIGNVTSGGFVPLADVPDDYWKSAHKRPQDKANHFADMDQKGEGEFAGQILLELCENPDNVDPDLWRRFYESLGIIWQHQGALPFRVWQIYDEMVAFVSAGKTAEFVCAAGILAHYVGDACQPLHVSYLHDGREGYPEAGKLHTDYETKMLNKFAPEYITLLNAALHNKKAKADVQGGKKAALSVVGLMRKTIDTLPPMEIIEAWNAASGAQRIPYMWSVLKDRTATCTAAGCVRLASLWLSAWVEGQGDTNIQSSNAISKQKLVSLYTDDDFIHSYTLKQLIDKSILKS